ncbi:MAG: MtrB/PioB family outer membrane beta-barrel protein, partial [Terriglobia bacterium]
MRNINQEYALVNRGKNFRFQAQYRAQSLDSQTKTIDFPGYAAFGDSTWRSPVTDFYNLRIENLDWDFTRQNMTAGFQWDVLPHLTWKLDYGGEYWNRKFRDVNRNNEHSIRARLDFADNHSGGEKKGGAGKAAPPGGDKTDGAHQDVEPKPVTSIRLKADYRYSGRHAQFYNTQPLTFCPSNLLPNVPPNDPLSQCPPPLGGSPASSPQAAWVVRSDTPMKQGLPIEFNLLRRFDETDRTRQDSSLSLELLRGARMNFSASTRYLADEHDKNFYGRLFNKLFFVDAQFSYAFENGNHFFASYSREANRFKYRDLAHLLQTPTAVPANVIVQGTLAQFPIANTWERTSRSSLDSFEFGINSA